MIASSAKNSALPAAGFRVGDERLIKVTEGAGRKVASLLKKQGRPGGVLRVAIVGGGCSGLQYKMDLQDGGFKVKNPNAATSCSCGESFSA